MTPTRTGGSKPADREPVAIVGIGCRFPGAGTPFAFWSMLAEGREALEDVPADRFDIEEFYDRTPATPGKVMTRRGGFVRGLDTFDAGFFNLSAREAIRLDPQQRLLLETAWDAIEDAGLVPARLAGSHAGVFVGLWNNEYESRLFAAPDAIDFHMTIGSGRYAASGRLSYFFGLQGPSLTVDTGCSSSLVAVHLACQSLWRGESELALAGGANAILEPFITIAYSQSQMMAPDGRCKFGDARADGYVRSDGAGVVVLKPLSRALADGDPIYATIVGSAVTNDGQSSGHLTTPGLAGQEEMLRRAYLDAGISPGSVDYVEAHGTGTRAGDPVELNALGEVLSVGRPVDHPCRVGSVKTNIGHTEGAAGIAGLIKAALSLEHEAIPPSLNFESPNPDIPWSSLPLVVPRTLEAWPRTVEPRTAGVSSFGIAGTNAHIVLREAPVVERASIEVGSPLLLPISARDPGALKAVVAAYQSLLSTGDEAAATTVCRAAAVRRGHHGHRCAFAAADRNVLLQQMEAFGRGEPAAGVSSGRAQAAPKVVFVFPGQGSQWLGMGTELLGREPVFRREIEACDAAIREEAGWSLIEELGAPAASSRLGEIDVVQPSLFAIEVALAALWRSWGFEPHAVIGHSMGELAAAYVAGVLSLPDAVAVICRRSRLLKRASGQGAMAVVELSIDEANEALRGRERLLSVAVSNSARSTVISGVPGELDALIAELEAREVFCRRIKVDVASHSPQMDALTGDLAMEIDGVEPMPGAVPFYSTVSATLEAGETCGPAYWVANLRQPVLFGQTVRRLIDEGHTLFVEMSPHPLLIGAVTEAQRDADAPGTAVGSLRREEPELLALCNSVGAAYAAGADPAWDAVHHGASQMTPLPAYPFQRERFWHDAEVRTPRKRTVGEHPLLGARIDLADDRATHRWQNELSPEEASDPLTWIEVLVSAASRATGQTPLGLRQIELAPRVGPSAGPVRAQTSVLRSSGGWRVEAHLDAGDGWRLRASAVIDREPPTPAPPRVGDRLALPKGRARDLREMHLPPATIAAAFAELDPPCPAAADIISVRRLLVERRLGESGWISAGTREADGLALQLANDEGTAATFEGVQWSEPTEAPSPSLEQSLFVSRWLPADLSGPLTPVAARRYVILADEGGRAEAIARELRAKGDAALVVGRPRAELQTTEQVLSLLTVVTADDRPFDIIDLWTADPSETFEVQAERVTWHLTLWTRALVTLSITPAPTLTVVTSGAMAVDDGDTATAVGQASAWGAFRALIEGHPELDGGIVDLDPQASPEEAATSLVDELHRRSSCDQVAYRRGRRYGLRLQPMQSVATNGVVDIDPGGAYLITGGLGALGGYAARWLVSRGASRLILVGRTPLPPRNEWAALPPTHPAYARVQSVMGLERDGAAVHVAVVDVADPAALSEWHVEYQREGWPPIVGLVHCAGALVDELAGEARRAVIEAAVRPKVMALANLERTLSSQPVSLRVIFSSAAALIPIPGQMAYAAANACLGAWAEAQKSRTTIAIDWSVWADAGMSRLFGAEQQFGARGVARVTRELATQVLDRIGALGPHVAVVPFVPDVWAHQVFAPSTTAFLAEAFPPVAGGAVSAVDRHVEDSWLPRLRAARDVDHRNVLQELLVEALGTVLQQAPDRIDVTAPFKSMGVDSLMGLELRNRVERATATKLPATLVWNYPSVALLAQELSRRLQAAGPVQQVAVSVSEGLASHDDFEELLADLEKMSDDDARRLLAGEG
jgi:acyl transferase domain-containing protein/NADP-dependent 3-hydroxy acid dehydrogenase YdfG/acyl carrier protein